MLTQVLLPNQEQQCGTGGATHPAGQVSSPASDDRRAQYSGRAVLQAQPNITLLYKHFLHPFN